MTNKKNKSIRLFVFFGAIVFAIVLAVIPFFVNNRDKTDIVFESSSPSILSSSSYYGASYYSDSVNNYFVSIYSLYFYLCMFNHEGDHSIISHHPVICNFSFSSSGFRVIMRDVSDLDGEFYSSASSSYYNGSQHFSANVNGVYTIECIYDSSFVFTSVSLAYYYSFSDDYFNYFCVGITDTSSHSIELRFSTDFTHGMDNRDELNFSPVYISISNSQILNDNDYYVQGKLEGLQQGRSEGDSAGYLRGRDDGFSLGERSGYNDGLRDANTYTFLGLFGAIVDAPLQAFTGLFDFDISFDGVHNFNLKGFFLAILTIAIVVAIIRFALSK